MAVLPFVLAAAFGAPQASAATIAKGTVMVSTGSGKVTEYKPDGTFITQIDTTTASANTTGSGFDSKGNFFVTDFQAQKVSKFDPTGFLLLANFGGPYNADPESVTFDKAGNVYVGQADGARTILKFGPSGTLLDTFAPATEERGTDFTELAADQCTLFYTSEGKHVKRFNACTKTQLADFNVAPLPGSNAYAHRLFSDGGMLVANTSEVTRLDPSGKQIFHYTLPGQTFSLLFAVNRDPDGTSFWTADLFSGKVFRVDIATGKVLTSWPSAGAAGFTAAGGLAVKGELTVIQGGGQCRGLQKPPC
jgi:streptogramin lyase